MSHPLPSPSVSRLPRWRGFNLTSMFKADLREREGEETYRIIADWGFNFVRLPTSYLCWTPDPTDVRRVDETQIAEIDRAIEWGRKFGIHINLNLHRGPGYTVAKPPEPRDLWTDASAQADFAWVWGYFAKRYKGIDNRQLSFDLINEPALTTGQRYRDAVKPAVDAIRAEDADRLVIADGLEWGREAVPELASLGVAQSTRGYDPMPVSHADANWINRAGFPAPAWPLEWDGVTWDRAHLHKTCIDPWKKLEAQGVGVHVGEMGAFNKTPHDVALRWMEDLLSLWQEAGWGWALWNFRGGFGVLDSERTDVAYEPFQGHQLDRKMLDLLMRY